MPAARLKMRIKTGFALLLILLFAGYFARSSDAERLNGVPLSDKDGQASRMHGVRIDGTRILVIKSDGTTAGDRELVGAVLTASDESGIKERFRIDSMEKYFTEQTGEIYLYTFSTQDPVSGEWKNFCKPDAKKRQKGFPLSGYWDKQGNHVPSETEYSITCTSGTIGKCVLFGYLPWKKDKTGQSLWGYHQACSRLLRADYCGNGNPHTRDGTLIELYDRLDVQVDTSEPGLSFEGAWNKDGAVCLRKTRIPELADLKDILKECPEKLRGKTGEDNCTESFADPSVLILNRSPIALNP